MCLAPKESFKEDPIAIVEPSKDTEKLETNKKHIPQISVTKACKLVPDECEDVNIRIGEVIHPMLPSIISCTSMFTLIKNMCHERTWHQLT